MKNEFSLEEVVKIARLSALELTDKELKNFVIQFSEILNYFELLKTAEIPEIDEENTEKNIFVGREDKFLKSPVAPEHFSPYLEERFFKIPRVIDQGK